MMGGSSPAGSTTVTQINPTAEAQRPFLTGGWSQASQVQPSAAADPPQAFKYFPGQTLADFDPSMGAGYQGMVNSGYGQFGAVDPAFQSYLDTLQPGDANDIYRMIGLSGTNAPFAQVSGLNDVAGRVTGSAGDIGGQVMRDARAANPTGAIQGLYDTVGWAAQPTFGTREQQDVALGKYVGANPYLDAAIAAAQRPTTRAFQTVTSPGVDLGAEGSGRFGSGLWSNERNRALDTFLTTQGETANKFAFPAYMAERQAQDAAAQRLEENQRARIAASQAGYTGAGGLGVSAGDMMTRAGLGAGGLTTQAGDTATRALLGSGGLMSDIQRNQLTAASGMNAEEVNRINAIKNLPLIQSGMMTPNQSILAGGQGLTGLDQAQIQDEMNRFYGTQEAPWKTLDRYMSAIGQPTGSSSSTSTPYFQNPAANILGAGTGALGLAQGAGNLFGGGGGLAGLFGAGAGPALAGVSSGALPAVVAPELGAAGLSALAGMNTGGTAAALASAALPAAATIICTELVKQGRMPNKWRLAGMRAFAKYPAIARRGYWVWAVPVVQHLRNKPDSLFSRVIATTFNWRAEDIAARVGVKGARRLWRGRMVTAAMVLPCLVCGLVSRDWREAYEKDAPA